MRNLVSNPIRWLVCPALAAGVLSTVFTLCGCDLPVHKPSISDALAPELAAPNASYGDWHSSLGQDTSINLTGIKSVTSGNALVVPQKPYQLVDLVDLGLRANPATRNAWEQARAAAAGLGITESAWLPVLTAKANSTYGQQTQAIFLFRGTTTSPSLELSWALFDKARPAKIDQATQQLLAANFDFNRTHQKVAFEVQRAIHALVVHRLLLHKFSNRDNLTSTKTCQRISRI